MNTTTRITTAFPSSQSGVFHASKKSLGNGFLTFLFFFSVVFSALPNMVLVTTVEASSHQVKLLEIPLPTGTIPKTLTFPVYEQDSIKYFCAGLGKEERSLTYPPFPLKLIFVQGRRAYLTGVSILLANQDGTPRLNIPGEEVEGPWLFIDVPTGTYVVNGTNSNGTTIEKIITVKADQSTVVYFRFP